MQSLFPNENQSFQPGDPNAKVLRQWEQLKQKLASVLEPREYQEWLAPLRTRVTGPSEMVISVPNMVFYQGFLERFLDRVEYFKATLGLDLLLRFEIEGGADDSTEFSNNRVAGQDFDDDLEQPAEIGAQDFPAAAAGEDQRATVSRALSYHSQLNTEYCFETFVNGPSNQFAHASCLAVADAPGQTYNPLFLYGSTGLGKTHLLHAVGNKVLKDRPNAVVTYISSERFMNEMIYCVRFNRMMDFRRKYRNSDVLLVDDIQFISGKERTQEEFFHTFNALYEAKKQIVVTSDVFPQDIPDIEDRLRNRFQWGLIADIQPPDVEHRLAILMNKAEKQGIRLSGEVAEYIAYQAKGSVRVLEGALRRVAAFSTLQGRPLDITLASELLQKTIGESPRRITVDVIQKSVADHFKLKIADLKSKKRQRAYSVPRQIAMYLARSRTSLSFPEIGEKFGGKDHTTVMHAVKKIEVDRGKDLDIKAHIESLERKLDQLC